MSPIEQTAGGSGREFSMPQLRAAPSGQCWSGFGLTLTVTKSDDFRANVRLAGDLDLASARLLCAALEHELDSGRRYLRLDLSGLSFIDSAGVAALVDALWAFLERRGTVIILGISARARLLLELTATDSILFVAAVGATGIEPVTARV
jgi:anti-anti-sigma factor